MGKNKFIVHKISAEDWKNNYLENAHLGVFGENTSKEKSRLDYALLVLDEKEEMVIYMTIQESTGDLAFIEYGGSFPNKRGTPDVLQAFLAGIDFLRESYLRLNFYVKNTNYAMLKLAMKAKFKIVGICHSADNILLEHTLELKKENTNG